MDPKAYARLYEGETADAHYFNTRLEIVTDMMQGPDQGKVLDSGCGPGVMMRNLVDRNWKVVGLDLSFEMVQEGMESIGITASSDFICADARQIPFVDTAFDIVLAMGVLEYVKDMSGAVSELARVTKKNGFVIMTMQNKISPYRLWEKNVFSRWTRLYRKQKQAPSWIYAEKAFRRIAEANRLEVLDVVYYDFNLFLPPLDQKMPLRSAGISRMIEPFCRKHIKWLGSGYIVKTTKK